MSGEIKDFTAAINDFSLKINQKGVHITDQINAVIKQFMEEVEESSQEFNLEGKKIVDKLNNTWASIDELKPKIDELIQNIDPIIATGVYERCKRLKDDIDLFENQILSELNGKKQSDTGENYHGLRARERLNVFLVGEFSSGKTTFTRRLIKDFAGSIAPTPTTACLVIHKQGDVENLEVTFQKKIKVKEREKFEKFLYEYELTKQFENNLEIWTSIKSEKIFDNLSTVQKLNFLEKANVFPEIFEKIVWYHKKSGQDMSKNTFLDFIDLFDMPGFGGTSEHDIVIKNVFDNFRPDVILFLIKTGEGVASTKNGELLKKLLSNINYKQPPLFYWVYQERGRVVSAEEIGEKLSDKSFFDSRREDLDGIIDNLKNGSQELAKFPDECINYLQQSSILDARGPKEDTELAQNAVSFILKDYFVDRGLKYVSQSRKQLKDDTKAPQFEVMTYKSDTYKKGNPFINDRILARIKTSHDLSTDNIKRIFLDEFHIKDDELSDYPYDLKDTLLRWRQNINEIIDGIIDSIKGKKMFGKAKNVSIDRINGEFWKNYQKNDKGWQRLLYTVQAYHWLKTVYSGNIAMQYVNQIGMAILGNIEKDIKRLEEHRILLSVVAKLENKPQDEEL
jgi:hypothetical protein